MQWMALLFSLAVVGGQGLHTLESRRAPAPVTAVPLGPTPVKARGASIGGAWPENRLGPGCGHGCIRA